MAGQILHITDPLPNVHVIRVYVGTRGMCSKEAEVGREAGSNRWFPVIDRLALSAIASGLAAKIRDGKEGTAIR